MNRYPYPVEKAEKDIQRAFWPIYRTGIVVIGISILLLIGLLVWLHFWQGAANAVPPVHPGALLWPALRGTNPLPVPSDRLARRSNRPLALSRRLDFYRSLTRGRIRRAALIVATLLPLVAVAAHLAF